MRLYNSTIVLNVWAITALTVTGCQKTNFPATSHQTVDPTVRFINTYLTQSLDFLQKTEIDVTPLSEGSFSASKTEQGTEGKLNPTLAQAQLNINIAQAAKTAEKSNTNFISKLLIFAAIIGGIGFLLLFFLRSRLFSASKLSQTVSSLQALQFQSNQFTTITLDNTGQIIDSSEHSAQYFTENLSKTITLEMIYLKGGIFTMGSPPEEGKEQEKPQHEVIVQPFFMGKYPVTQEQWKAVAMLPKVKRSLNIDPSKYKSDNRPVENICWYDAVEFCQRLSQLTKRDYRLPTEAEWEYATRATTNTPFCFGETITTELANYKGIFTYAQEPKGLDRHESTPVDQFPPNAFGLYDLHGNVGEWCADTWHDNYQNAPTDGKAWIKNNNQNYRVSSPVRGGAWIGLPDDCRSAARRMEKRDQCNAYTGFRVVCEVGNIVIPERG